jgi:hypothetical protein
MNQPTPCPQCRSDRIWARAALGDYGITHVAFCPGCARAATLCGRCGGELVLTRHATLGVPGAPRVQAVLQCPSCRQTAVPIPGPRPSPGAPQPATREPVPAASLLGRPAARTFTAEPAAPTIVQRVTDDAEAAATERYVRRRRLVALLDEAARRADAMARLDNELNRLADPGPG